MENEKRYSITLSDGTKIENLELNGNNYISNKAVDKAIFDYNLDQVIISDGETEETYNNMTLIHVTKMSDGTYWFALRELSKDEIDKAKVRADIDYLYMMTDIEMA